MNVITGRSVVVTGGSGSFGNAFVRRMLEMDFGPARVCVFSRDESKQSIMRRAFGGDPRLRWFLGDVRDLERLKTAFVGADLVVHAAAMKIVPACEDNPFECFETNYSGSVNVIKAVIHCKVPRLVALSTDKAVQPCTTYGTSKLAMERAVINSNSISVGVSRLSCTRYGNVQDSRESVLPVWREQVVRQEELSVTDPDATRFHMEQREAVDLVLLAANHMQGGEVFVPKLPAYRLGDLATAFAPGWAHKVIGLRGTEKLHESLISPDEVRLTSDYGDHFRVFPAQHSWSGPILAGGEPLPEGFTYASNTVEQLTAEQLSGLVS